MLLEKISDNNVKANDSKIASLKDCNYIEKNIKNCGGSIEKYSSCEVIGKFKSDKLYLDAVKALISSTKETENRIQFIQKNIIPNICKDSVLDIGVGNGEQTSLVCNSFKSVELVDPSQNALDTINKSLFINKKIKKNLCQIENFKFPKKTYDLVLLSHILYYVPREKWEDLIQKAFESLKTGGTILVVLNNGLGRSKLTNHFGCKDNLKIESFFEQCALIKNSSVSIVPRHEMFAPKTRKDVIKIASVCFLDAGITANKNDVINYLNENFSVKESQEYEIDFIQYFIVLKKDF